MLAKYLCGAVELIDYTPNADVPAQTVVALGDRFGVATEDLPANRPASLAVSGVFVCVKAAGNAMTRGAIVAFDAGNDRVDDALTVGKPFGSVYAAPVTADTDVRIRLNDLTPPQAAVVAALVDNSGGTADGTLEDCNNAVTGVDGTGSNAASKADVDARLVSIANNLADLAAKVNAILTAQKNAGQMASA